ncbi:MAG: PIN domain-containing protein [Armatimonadetes bacterium]|nr:PIN domain-containing protein [Armatimonadota bacterium]
MPDSGHVYADANVAIYSVDRHPTYAPVCAPLWRATQGGTVQVVSSELILLETLVGPLRNGDAVLAARREALWRRADTRLVPITRDVLREAARLRARHTALRTPDAFHAATALLSGCVLFVTNDPGFRRILGLPLAILDEVVAAP